jgi:hypothetical protein
MPSRFHVTRNLRGHYFFKSLKKMKHYGHRNFHVQQESPRYARIVEYETVYFPKDVKYDELQQKNIRGLPKIQLFS